MRPQSIVMLVDGFSVPDAADAKSPAVDGQAEPAPQVASLSALILRTLDPAQWRLVHCQSVESAQEHFQAGPIGGLVPELVVLNVDVARGWPFCTMLKKNFASVPVIVVSERLNKEVFNGHQKLDTRADAYHRLPEELDGLEISLGYFASHKSETGEEEEGSSPRLKPRKAERVAVPSGLLHKLESTVAEQARALEDARQKIEALEAERDAVADKNRRQVIELMALHPGDSSGAELASLRDKVATLEARSLEHARLDEEARQLRAALGQAKAEVARLSERPDAEALVTRLQGEVQALKANEGELRQALDARAVELAALTTERDQLAARQSQARDKARVSSPGQRAPAAALEEAREDARREAVEAADQLAKASVQLSTLATELKNSHERRLQAEEALKRAEARAVELEQELSQRPAAGADLEGRLMEALARAEAAERAAAIEKARADQVLAQSQGALSEVERIANEKRSIDEALAMSRRLMREYATDAARKADELKDEQAKVKALAERAEAAEKLAAELSQSAEFGSSLVESLEREVAELRAQKTSGAAGDAGEREVLQKNLEQLAAGYRGLQADLERANAEREALTQKLAEASADGARTAQELDEARAEVFALSAERDHLAEKSAAAAASTAALEGELARLKKELDGVGQDHEALLENLQREFGELSRRQAEDAAALAGARAERDTLAAGVEALVAEVDQEKRARQFVYQAMAEHADLVAERFENLRVYARRLEGRLIEAETRRAELEAKLEGLLSEVRAQALYGEVPPAMEIPLAPVFIDEDEDGQDEESDDEGADGGAADAISDAEGDSTAAVDATSDEKIVPTAAADTISDAEIDSAAAADAMSAGKIVPTAAADTSQSGDVGSTADAGATAPPAVDPTAAADTSAPAELAPTPDADAVRAPEIAPQAGAGGSAA